MCVAAPALTTHCVAAAIGTDNEVFAMRVLAKIPGWTQADLARKYRVSRSLACLIIACKHRFSPATML